MDVGKSKKKKDDDFDLDEMISQLSSSKKKSN